jgi:hypothetical protein
MEIAELQRRNSEIKERLRKSLVITERKNLQVKGENLLPIISKNDDLSCKAATVKNNILLICITKTY